MLEAMACGLPVIASIQAGASENVRDFETGLLSRDPRDTVQLVHLIRRLFDDVELRIRIGEAGPRYVRDNCNRDQNVARTREFLRNATTLLLLDIFRGAFEGDAQEVYSCSLRGFFRARRSTVVGQCAPVTTLLESKKWSRYAIHEKKTGAGKWVARRHHRTICAARRENLNSAKANCFTSKLLFVSMDMISSNW